MQVLSVEVETRPSKMLPGMEEAVIMPISDVQWKPGPSFDADRFNKHVAWGVKNRAYYVGLGDMVDGLSPSNRRLLQAAYKQDKLYDTFQTMMDSVGQEHVDAMQALLRGTRGKWFGLLRGHHYWEFEDGSTSDSKLAAYLDAPFLGDSALIEVRFKGHTGRGSKFRMLVEHGSGSASTLGTPLNKLARRAAHWDADILLIGHHHMKVAGKIPVLDFARDGKLSHRNVILACTGSFLKGYLEGNERGGQPAGTYVEKALLNPVTLGGIVIRARPRKNQAADLEVSL